MRDSPHKWKHFYVIWCEYVANVSSIHESITTFVQVNSRISVFFIDSMKELMGPSKCCLACLRVFAVEEIDKANGFIGAWDGHCSCHMFFCLFSYTEYLYTNPNNQMGTQSHMVIELATLWTEHINLALAYYILINVGENKRIQPLPLSSFKIHIIHALQIPLKIWIIQLLLCKSG